MLVLPCASEVGSLMCDTIICDIMCDTTNVKAKAKILQGAQAIGAW